jgi:hypothetical protein
MAIIAIVIFRTFPVMQGMDRIRSPDILTVVVQGETGRRRTRGRQGDGSRTLILKFFRKEKFLKLMRTSLRAARMLSTKTSSVRLGAWSSQPQQLSYSHLGIGVTKMTRRLSNSRSSSSITVKSFCYLSFEASPRSPST